MPTSSALHSLSRRSAVQQSGRPSLRERLNSSSSSVGRGRASLTSSNPWPEEEPPSPTQSIQSTRKSRLVNKLTERDEAERKERERELRKALLKEKRDTAGNLKQVRHAASEQASKVKRNADEINKVKTELERLDKWRQGQLDRLQMLMRQLVEEQNQMEEEFLDRHSEAEDISSTLELEQSHLEADLREKEDEVKQVEVHLKRVEEDLKRLDDGTGVTKSGSFLQLLDEADDAVSLLDRDLSPGSGGPSRRASPVKRTSSIEAQSKRTSFASPAKSREDEAIVVDKAIAAIGSTIRNYRGLREPPSSYLAASTSAGGGTLSSSPSSIQIPASLVQESISIERLPTTAQNGAKSTMTVPRSAPSPSSPSIRPRAGESPAPGSGFGIGVTGIGGVVPARPLGVSVSVPAGLAAGGSITATGENQRPGLGSRLIVPARSPSREQYAFRQVVAPPALSTAAGSASSTPSQQVRRIKSEDRVSLEGSPPVGPWLVRPQAADMLQWASREGLVNMTGNKASAIAPPGLWLTEKSQAGSLVGPSGINTPILETPKWVHGPDPRDPKSPRWTDV